MKFMSLVLVLMVFMTFSVCLAQQQVEEAYTLFYKGKIEAAVEMMEEYVIDNPDPKALYFLGYAYYELQDMEKAREFFDRAYKAESFYSPMEKENN